MTPCLTQELAVTLRHFFPELAQWFGDIEDPRDPEYTVYALKLLLLLGVLMFLTHCGSRNQFNDQFRDSREVVRTVARLLGVEVEALPHLDTLEKVLRRLNPEQMETLLPRLLRRLIRMKALDDWRVGERFLLAIDATGLYSFRERHCVHCIEKRHANGTVTYSHQVMVAFIVSASGFALPIGCEFIENPSPIYNKQDCESKAFLRLAPRIKQMFPQTPFSLLLDALYADQTVMRLAIANGWNFFISFLDSDMSALWAEAQALMAQLPGQRATATLPQGAGCEEVRWLNDLDYHGLSLSVIILEENDASGHILRRFAYLTARQVDFKNIWKLAATARLRWRCENEGFNVLKNGGFGLEHVYSRCLSAAKIYFFLMLIAHVIQQLLTRGRLKTVFDDTFHTYTTYGRKLLEALRLQPLPQVLPMPGQIRLSTA